MGTEAGNLERILGEIEKMCKEFSTCQMFMEKRGRSNELQKEIKRLYRLVLREMDIQNPQLLLALLDAYEVTRDEGMLQEVLDVVSGNLERLVVSAENVKLLAYCYYYVEEEECAVKAREILRELKQRGENVAEAEKVLEELV